ncbi:unnamed protein product, partial [Musa hybrid cultivar]
IELSLAWKGLAVLALLLWTHWVLCCWNYGPDCILGEFCYRLYGWSGYMCSSPLSRASSGRSW